MTPFSPIDLLTLAPDEQSVLRCLTKEPRLPLATIAACSDLAMARATETVGRLLQQQRIVEQLVDGQRVFSARFQFRRSVRNMPAGLLSLYHEAVDNCLASAPLTSALSAELQRDLIALSQRRTLMPGELLVWQGEHVPCIALVEDGLLEYTRLQGQRIRQRQGYLRRTDWFGLVENFSESPASATYTALTETTLRCWQPQAFLDFATQHAQFATELVRHFGHLLRDCEQSHGRGQTRLWAIAGGHAGAGVTTFAFNLALLAEQAQPGTLLWAHDVPPFLQADSEQHMVGDVATVFTHPSGIDVLTTTGTHDYPAQVELDIILTQLARRYETIVCDTGSAESDERWLRLRGRAHTLITLTCDPFSAERTAARWAHLQPYATPGQKRVLALNRVNAAATEIDARFHLLLPDDCAAMSNGPAVVEHAAESRMGAAFSDVYRRLSLNHAVAIFVPSTVDVDESVDNAVQVQSALSFLGGTFGGATSSDAEGVWRSEDSGLVTEQVTIVRTFVSKRALDQHLDDVIGFASDLKRDMKQEAVAISVDNQLILV
jgi:CRP-like cAMP-binding protein